MTNQCTESDQNDGTTLVLNAGYLDQQEKTDRRIQRAITEDSSDTGKLLSLKIDYYFSLIYYFCIYLVKYCFIIIINILFTIIIRLRFDKYRRLNH